MQTITVTMTADQAQALWSLATQMMDGLSLHRVGEQPLWTAMVGTTRVTIRDYELDQAARGMCAIREALNTVAKGKGDPLGMLLELADSVPHARPYNGREKATAGKDDAVYLAQCEECGSDFPALLACDCERCGRVLCGECVCDCDDQGREG